jgi:hypothetical protein
MNVPKYQVGDLVILKPELWRSMPEYENIVGVIVGIGVQAQEKKSFFVRFEKLVHILNDRIIWSDDILKHYPVVK